MSFKAFLTQSSEGCDYTIGCGICLIDLKATTLDAAMTELRAIVAEHFVDEAHLARATILNISQETPIPIETWYGEFAAQQAQDEQIAQEQRERAEYERLRQKFI